MKVVSKHIFSIVYDGKAQRCGCTKVDALIIKKDSGCMINKNRKKLEELQQASKVLIEHILNKHGSCSVDWFSKTRAPEEGK